MHFKHYLLITSLFALTLSGCTKSDSNVTPAPTTTTTADLLVRKWSFADVSVKTDAKSYAIPTKTTPLFGDDNTLTFNKANTFTYLDAGKTATGTWTLTNDKTLVTTDADKVAYTWTINTLTATNLDLSSITVDLTKGNDLTDTKIYKADEQMVATITLFLLASLDKSAGGTIDFSKEPKQKSVQLIAKGIAK